MIKTVIFDLNGVFITSPKLSERYEKEFGVTTDKFLPVLKETLTIARLPGSPDIYELWRPHLTVWGLDLTREEFLDFWFRAEGNNEEMLALARELKAKGLKLFILSNNFRERAEYYDRSFSFLKELFAKVYYSWQTGFVKSDRQAYELVLRENNLKPEEVVFFDDSESNIELAKSLGIEAYLFEGAEDVRNRLV